MKRVIDSYSDNGVQFKLIKENDEYIIERKEGKYIYNKNLGKIDADKAQYKFINFGS